MKCRFSIMSYETPCLLLLREIETDFHVDFCHFDKHKFPFEQKILGELQVIEKTVFFCKKDKKGQKFSFREKLH